MVTAKTQYSGKSAKEYFEEHLVVGDYYDESHRVSGEWFGSGAERLRLSGRIRSDEFLQLCKNQNPADGRTLTQRLNTTRIEDGGKSAANRRIFYDFTFSPPKSVSLSGLLADDERVVAAHGSAVRTALREFEAFAATRVRASGANRDRMTGNFVAALFTHDTSRALDPHLHTHCIVFNATFDPSENRWKALQNHDLLRAKKFAENVYYHELARQLIQCGYGIQNRSQGDFQIAGISEELCAKFSKRHGQIDAAMAMFVAEKPGTTVASIPGLRAQLATERRARKQKDLSREELRTLWKAQVAEVDLISLSQISKGVKKPAPENTRISSREAVEWAEKHLFDRNSVVLESQIWQHALERIRGADVSVTELKTFTDQRGYIRKIERPGEVTLRDVLLREWAIVQIAKEGLYSSYPLAWNPPPANPNLDDEQREAFDALVSNTSVVSIFRGGAGTGKSFVLQELVDQVQQSGRPVVVLAPQRQQVAEMEKAGFPSPTTVTGFLQKRELPKGALIVVDEAGQIGGRQMLELMQLVREQNARLILSGDTRQYGAVEASDALLAIERHAGVRPVELRKIRRQDPALGRDRDERKAIRQYRNAVEAAASGKFDESFDRLDKMGAVVACGLAERTNTLALEYLRLAEQNASAVIVSQTWAEVHRINSSVRDALKDKGLLGSKDFAVQVLDRIDLTNAQKSDERFHSPDTVIVFNQKVRDAEPGARGKLGHILESSVLVEVDGRYITVSNRMLDRISVCQRRELSISEGDRLHLRANRKLSSGGRATNGEIVTVKSVQKDGAIRLADGRLLDPTYREFLPGYAITSYGSQGKTVDYVLFSDSTVKAATNSQQWYVTISRGRRGVRIFTPDKEQLRENVARSGHRPLALDLAGDIRPQTGNLLWDRLHGYLLRFGQHAADTFCRLKIARRRNQYLKHEHQITRMLGQ